VVEVAKNPQGISYLDIFRNVFGREQKVIYIVVAQEKAKLCAPFDGKCVVIPEFDHSFSAALPKPRWKRLEALCGFIDYRPTPS
jgi:hypothetical protein